MGTLAVFIESYVFPVVFVYFVYDHLRFFHDNSAGIWPAIERLLNGHMDISNEDLIAGASANFFIILLNCFIIYGLLMRRNLKQKPRGAQEIIVPLIATFFFLAYSFVSCIPGQVNIPLLPQNTLGITILIGILFNFCGAVVSIIATYQLRYSYGVFVQLRDILSKGIYRFVRHPIYFGYTLSTIGFLLVVPRLAYLVLFIVSLLITIYRAKLEEKTLMTSPEYQQYAQKTPFLIPGIYK